MKKLFVICMTIILMFSNSYFAFSAESDIQTQPIQVHWDETFSSITELDKAASLVVVGTVISQSSFLYNRHVYTKSLVTVENCISGQEDKSVQIIQIGGTANNVSTEFPHELGRLQVSQQYVFFLKGTDNIYHILGAGQGVFAVNNQMVTKENYIDYCSPLFEEKLPSLRTPPTPATGYAFPKGTTFVEYYYAADCGVSSTAKSYFQTGIASWNGLSQLTISQTTNATNGDILIYLEETGTVNTGTLAITYMMSGKRCIDVYTDHFSPSNYTYWRKIGAHEMGHAIGLGHNTWSDSVMAPYIDDQSIDPEYYDIVTLRDLYGNPW